MFLKQKKYYIPLVLVGLLVIFVSLNIILSFATENISADMTTDKKYSLSDYTREQIKKITQPVYITVYYSSEIASENPIYGRYAEYVFKFLKQYQKLSSNKINIAIKDPIPYSAVEKEAKKYGIQAFPSVNGNVNMYFGAVFSDGDKKRFTLANISKKRDFWLEKDITLSLSRIIEPQKEVVGLISPVHKMIARNYGQGSDVYAVIQELSEKYDVAEFPENIKEIPADVKVLLLVTPRHMPPSLNYAIDQYVMRGGKLIIFADMIVENPYYITPQETLIKMNELFKNWGVKLTQRGVGSLLYGQEIYLKNSSNEIQKTPYPLWLDLPKETFNSQIDIMSDLTNIRMKNAVEIKEIKHDENISVTPIIKISNSGTYNREQLLSGKQYIVSNYKADEKNHALAVLIEGKFSSMYHQPPEMAADNKFPYMYYSAKPAQILIIGDSDMLRDDVWLENEVLSDNGQLVWKAIDRFNGSTEHSVLYKTQQQSKQKSLGEQIYEKIVNKYSETANQKISELDELRQEYDDIQRLVNKGKQSMDAYTAQRLNIIRDKVLDIEKSLQQYEYNIQKSFEAQKQIISWINILLLPLLIVMIWLGGFQIYNRHRRKKIEEKYNAR